MLPLAIIPQQALDVLESILTFWHDVVGGGANSWGFAIILLTFTIRLFILPLTFKSVKSMQALQVLQPEMKEIQARFKDDKQRLNQEMMKFYQENKVNPLGSCLPLLLQIPFFIGLFELLRSDNFKEDIAGNESFFFIPDLAGKLYPDHIAVLAFMIVLYVGTQLAASLITMVGGDKNQQRIMLALPVRLRPLHRHLPGGPDPLLGHHELLDRSASSWSSASSTPSPSSRRSCKEARRRGQEAGRRRCRGRRRQRQVGLLTGRAAPEVAAQEEEALRAAAVARLP